MGKTHQDYRPLGPKTLFVIIMRKVFFSIFLLILWIAVLYASAHASGEYSGILLTISSVLGIVIFISIFLTILLGTLEYKRYGVFIEEESLRITTGLFNTEEQGIPYRYIKEVSIKRSVLDQIIGISKIIITILGEIDDQPQFPSEKTILRAIDKRIAEEIRDGVLGRAELSRSTCAIPIMEKR